MTGRNYLCRSMNGTLDHVMFVWEDLDDITNTFTQLGLNPDYGGVHPDRGTEMAMVGFEDGSYLELIAPTNTEELPQQWPEKMFSAGPYRWCLEVDDLRHELERLSETGTTVKGPAQNSRERPDGTLIEYEVIIYGTEETVGRLPFLIKDITPQHYRVQISESIAGSSLTGVAQVVIAVEDVDEATDQFQRLHDYPSPLRADHEAVGATLVSFPDTPVILAEPLDDTTWIANRLSQYQSRPCAFLLGSSDFAATTAEYQLTGFSAWFGSQVGWFDSPKLEHKIGVIEQ